MYRIIAAIVLSVFIGIVIFTGRTVTSNQCNEHREQIDNAMKNIMDEDWESVEKTVNKAMDNWGRGEQFLIIFLQREALDEMSISYNELYAAVKMKDKSIAYSKCYVLNSLIDEIEEKESFSLKLFF